MMSPAQLAITTVDTTIRKVTGTVIKVHGWEGKATAAQPKCIAGAKAHSTSHCCILDKTFIHSSHWQPFSAEFCK